MMYTRKKKRKKEREEVEQGRCYRFPALFSSNTVQGCALKVELLHFRKALAHIFPKKKKKRYLVRHWKHSRCGEKIERTPERIERSFAVCSDLDISRGRQIPDLRV